MGNRPVDLGGAWQSPWDLQKRNRTVPTTISRHFPAKPGFRSGTLFLYVKIECRIGILVWPENAAKSSRGQSGYAFAAPMVIARHPPRSTTERQRKEGVGDSIADPPRDRIVGWVAAQPTGAGFERSASLQARDSMVLLRGPHPHPQPATCPVG